VPVMAQIMQKSIPQLLANLFKVNIAYHTPTIILSYLELYYVIFNSEKFKIRKVEYVFVLA
jgi:hypothetical protein